MVKLKRVLAAVKIRTYLKNLIMKTAFVIIKIQNFKMDSLFKFEQVRSARDAREKDTIVEEKGKAVISQEVGEIGGGGNFLLQHPHRYLSNQRALINDHVSGAPHMRVVPSLGMGDLDTLTNNLERRPSLW